MRVLAVTMFFHPQVGGAEKQAQKLSKKLMGKGVDVRILTGWWFKDTPKEELIDDLPVIRCFAFWQMFGIKGLRKFGAYTYLLSLFLYLVKHRHEYDIIHIHQLAHHAFVCVVAAKLFGKKSLIKVGNSGRASDIKVMQENRQVWGTRQMLPKIRECDCIIAISSLIEEELLANGFRADQIYRIPNGVEVNHTITPKSDYSIANEVSLTYVGRMHWQKGPDLLLDALKKIAELRPDLRWQLTMLGSGPQSSHLKRQAQEYGIADRIKFRGIVDNVPDYLAKTDIFVLPSRAEGLSNALLEAMAAGLPCVVTNIVANAEVIQDDYNGLLTPEEDEEAMAQSLLYLIDDETLRARLGKQARQTVVERYSLDAVADRYVELYQDLLSGARVSTQTYSDSPAYR